MKVFLKKKKKKSENMVVIEKMKNKTLLSIEKNIIN